MTLVKFKRNNAIPRSFEGLVTDLINDVFENEPKTKSAATAFTPKTNIIEGEKEYTIQLALPGWNRKDVELSLDNEVLIIKGKKDDKKSEKSILISREFGYGRFEKRFQLPEDAGEDISAALDNGLLEVTINKKVKQEVKKSISIN